MNKISLPNLKGQLADIIIANMPKAIDYVKSEVDTRTPEDTRTLLGNNQTLPIRVDGNKVIGEVVNETDYAGFVEYGVGNKKYRYNKPKGTIFRVGVGARMFSNTADSDDVINNVTKILG